MADMTPDPISCRGQLDTEIFGNTFPHASVACGFDDPKLRREGVTAKTAAPASAASTERFGAKVAPESHSSRGVRVLAAVWRARQLEVEVFGS
ncbi:hypothetical protein F442_00316 [Phytophthora nicotianae P10297]|uniref:Uncharacterized protein n=1 Tax=Phytophthora nicotianae P10297 TaxID=1317064 RepID=W3A787_PHYNI|nr:hypothetical protein F442_00316 [Phytophthora nicotianae P10297]